MGQNFVDLKLYPLPVHSLFASNFCPTILQPANWTLKIDVTTVTNILHFERTITNHKEIGRTDTLYQVGLKIMFLLFQVDRPRWVKPKPSVTGHDGSTLYSLDFAAES